MTSEYKHYED